MDKTLVRKSFCFLGVVVIPFLIMWTYLYVSRTRDLYGFYQIILLLAFARLSVQAQQLHCQFKRQHEFYCRLFIFLRFYLYFSILQSYMYARSLVTVFLTQSVKQSKKIHANFRFQRGKNNFNYLVQKQYFLSFSFLLVQ